MDHRIAAALLCIPLCWSCGRTENESSPVNAISSVVATETPAPPDTLDDGMGCYYKLDDKYSTVTDPVSIAAWWDEVLKGVERDGLTGSLFAMDGGGPCSAHWNPSTDLYVLACFSDSLSRPTLELKLNGKPAPEIGFEIAYPVSKKGTFISFVLPLETWQKNELPLSASLTMELCGANYASARGAGINEVEIEFTASPKSGHPMTFAALFHTAYGE